MKNIRLFVPNLEDLWFRQTCLADKETMNYNAVYDVLYKGYHYDTGCIDFPKEDWEKWFKSKIKNPNFFYAYILDVDTNNFVGQVNFNINSKNAKATMGIVIKHEFRGQGYMRPAMSLLLQYAKAKGIDSLTDTIPETRKNALKVFYDFDFKKVGEFKMKKFNECEKVIEIEKKLI